MKTKPKTKQLMKRSAGRSKNLRSKFEAYTPDDVVARVEWNRRPDRSAKLEGYNKAGLLIEHLGRVEPSGKEWLGVSAGGVTRDFVKHMDAMSWVKSQSRKNNPSYSTFRRLSVGDSFRFVLIPEGPSGEIYTKTSPSSYEDSSGKSYRIGYGSVGVVKNPSFLTRLKEVGKDVKHALTKKKKSAAALKRLREANPEGEASEMFETFHGVPSKEVIEFKTRFHVHENLAGLGHLTELVFFTPGAKPEKVTLEEADLGDAAWLCSSEDGKQLFVLGEVEVNLEELGYRDDVDVKDAVELGRLTNVVYRTQKEFHQLKMLDYDHRLGKREKWQKDEGVGPDMNKAVAECPILAYYPRENRFAVIGGQYLILAEGISN